VLIEFSVLNPISPKAVGTGPDTRELGLGLSKLTFSQVSESTAEYHLFRLWPRACVDFPARLSHIHENTFWPTKSVN